MATPSKRVAKNLLLILPLLILCAVAAILIPTLLGDGPPLGTTVASTTVAPITTTAVTTTVAPPSTVAPSLSPPSPTPTAYTVTFSVDGKVTQKTVDVDAKTAPLPQDPEKQSSQG